MSIAPVNLLYGYERVEGGVLALGIHLAKSLTVLDVDCRIIKIGKRGLKSASGIPIFSVPEEEFVNYLIPGRSVVVNMADLYLYTPSRSRWAKVNEQIFFSDIPIVIHDAKCFTLDHRGHTMPDCKYIVCRKAVYNYMDQAEYNATLVPYPYYSVDCQIPDIGRRPRNAICHSRIAPEKGIEIILQANEALLDDKKVLLIGGRNMMFVNFRLRKSYPDWEKSWREIDGLYDYPLHYNSAMLQKLLTETDYSVDLTYLPLSGSSVQYTFLEAMSAGCHLILNQDWIQGIGDMIPGWNCTTISSPTELAQTLMRPAIKFDCRSVLDQFKPNITVPKWMEAING